MKICNTPIDDVVLGRLQSIIDENENISPTALARRVCGTLNWRNAKGQLLECTCRIGLNKLGKKGWLRLPSAAAGRIRKPYRRIPVDLPKAKFADFSGTLAEFGPVELVAVRGAKKSRLWNGMMDTYHYLGSGPLCGAQMRYLVFSRDHGWLGGLSWSASAFSLQCRDDWIGWDDWSRDQNRNSIVCNSRFLIMPTVKVPHLASHVLGKCVRQLPEDWHERYGQTPLLAETFVDEERFRGTCYRAANWQEIGCTKGRGRQDRRHEYNSGIKRVLVYELCSDARRELRRTAIPPPERQYATWTEEEFGGVDLGDRRLNRRLCDLAESFYNRPQANIPQSCSSRAATKAAYRFFDHPEVNLERILLPHYKATKKRVQDEKIVLAVQDTTSLNYTGLKATAGLGPIGTRTAADGAIGLIMHDTMAFTPQGTPLGLIDLQCWARPPEPCRAVPKSQKRYQPIEEKESCKWLKSYAAASVLQRECPDTLVVSVGDREADIFELFQQADNTPDGAALLVRGRWDRRLVDPEHKSVMAAMEHAKVGGTLELSVPRQNGRPARTASAEVRYRRVTLRPPDWCKGSRPVSVWAVQVREAKAPPGADPLDWTLFTTLPVDTFDQALEKVGWYSKRWGIEIFHRTLKSGCRIEERQLGTADRLEACLAIDLVVAWRVYYLAWLGRESPDIPCTVFFQEAEWKALYVKVTRNPKLPEEPPSLREAIRMVASLGGFLGRKCDGEPGNKALWLGIQRLDDITDIFVFMLEHFANGGDPVTVPPQLSG